MQAQSVTIPTTVAADLLRMVLALKEDMEAGTIPGTEMSFISREELDGVLCRAEAALDQAGVDTLAELEKQLAA